RPITRASGPQPPTMSAPSVSTEEDRHGTARRSDRYPNLAVDTAARMEYLMLAPPEKVRAFLIKYQDRVLYGTDLDLLATAKAEESLKDWQSAYARDWRFFATDDLFEQDGRKVQGLKLLETGLRKLYRTNALHWLDGFH